MADKRLIDAYGEYSLVAADNTDYVLMFANETIGVYDNRGHILAEFDPDDIPKVDAVEAGHGVWCIDDCDSGDPGYYSAYIEVHCSKCGYELGAESGQYGWVYGDPFPLNFCPNCGAKMDGGAEDGH